MLGVAYFNFDVMVQKETKLDRRNESYTYQNSHLQKGLKSLLYFSDLGFLVF